jgi:hypothetical protein
MLSGASAMNRAAIHAVRLSATARVQRNTATTKSVPASTAGNRATTKLSPNRPRNPAVRIV